MNLKQLNIAAAKALELKPFKFEANGISYKGKPFTLTDPACMNRVIEHFRIDVITDGYDWWCVTDEEIHKPDKDRDTAIMKCVEKCLLKIEDEG